MRQPSGALKGFLWGLWHGLAALTDLVGDRRLFPSSTT